MSKTLKRTSIALDDESHAILNDPGRDLGISKAEVIRPSLRKAQSEWPQGHNRLRMEGRSQGLKLEPLN